MQLPRSEPAAFVMFFRAVVTLGWNFGAPPTVRKPLMPLAWRVGDVLGWGDLIGAYGAAHAAYRRSRGALADANRLFETLRELGMSEQGGRRAADLDRLLGETLRARARLQAALREIQSNVELVRALNLVAAAEGISPDHLQPFVPDNDAH